MTPVCYFIHLSTGLPSVLLIKTTTLFLSQYALGEVIAGLISALSEWISFQKKKDIGPATPFVCFYEFGMYCATIFFRFFRCIDKTSEVYRGLLALYLQVIGIFKLLKDILISENMIICFMPTAYCKIPPTSHKDLMYRAPLSRFNA
jgi:hypothetical protein